MKNKTLVLCKAHVCVHECTHTHTHTCTHAHTHACTHARTHARMHACTHTKLCHMILWCCSFVMWLNTAACGMSVWCIIRGPKASWKHVAQFRTHSISAGENLALKKSSDTEKVKQKWQTLQVSSPFICFDCTNSKLSLIVRHHKFCGKKKKGLRRSRSRSQRRLKMLVNICLDDILWTTEYFVAKPGTVMRHYKSECH